MDAEGIHGIVGSPEVVAGALVEVGDVDVAAHTLDGEVGVAVEASVSTCQTSPSGKSMPTFSKGTLLP